MAQLAREKEGLEGRVREAGKQLTFSEQAREQLGSEVAGLRATSRETENWQREKQVCVCVCDHCGVYACMCVCVCVCDHCGVCACVCVCVCVCV